MHHVRAFRLLAALSLCSIPALQAQSGLGAINGRVTDATSAPIAHVSVKLTNVATGVVAETFTDDAGIYNVLSLVLGQYRLVAEKAGFEKSAVESITISASQTATIDVGLQVGQISDVVTVQAQAPLLTPTTPTQAATIERELVENLPFPERSSLGVALLVAGVQGDVFNPGGVAPENPGIFTGYITPGASLGVGGATPGRSVIMVDGSDVTQSSFPRAGISVSGDLVEETTVVTGGIPAQYGRTMGGAIVQSTRGGTNQLHGSAS